MKKLNNEHLQVNDNLFQQAVSCPLKVFHYRKENSPKIVLPFKQRNKLRLRDAVAFQFENVKFTSDQTKTAARETEEWLKEDEIIICGAVIEKENYYTRIPVLRKQDTHFSVIQVHGKLRKRSQAQAITSAGKNRATDIYLLKAAYRVEVLKQRFPGSDINVQFFFPNRVFKASVENLLQRTNRKSDSDIDEKTHSELNELFACVDATQGTEEMRFSIPETVAHKDFAGSSLLSALENIRGKIWLPSSDYDMEIHTACKYCKYRTGKNGCWAQFFDRNEITHPYFHVFELIGHGNNVEAESGFYYQEEVPVQEAFQSFEAVKKTGGKKITIQQRRLLQLLKSREETVPEIWAKPGIQAVQTLSFPLHFIDFEAATYALPMHRTGGAYDPVYFQFSCHTLQENGELTHTEWLDSDSGSGYPHQDFVNQLAAVKDIFQGTLVQYSPFEGQALNYLYREFGKNSMLYKKELTALNELINLQGQIQTPRLFDLSKLIRDSYFNWFFDGSLGLKSVLTGILKRIKQTFPEESSEAKIYDLEIDMLSHSKDGGEPDPYKEIQHPLYQIEDGAEAMHAYISLKNENLSEEEKEIIPGLLKRYCALDSYAMVVIFQHLKELAQKIEKDDDLIIFS
ncbi:MAG: DUF2779 domain-containing protein [Balneolaceae bacterium]